MTASVARWRRVVLDANVLVQAPIRDAILRAAEDELLVVYWGPTILEEVARALRYKLFADRPDAVARTNSLLQALARSFPEHCTVMRLLDCPPWQSVRAVGWCHRAMGMCWRRLYMPMPGRL